jgi:hypothetical protein
MIENTNTADTIDAMPRKRSRGAASDKFIDSQVPSTHCTSRVTR